MTVGLMAMALVAALKVLGKNLQKDSEVKRGWPF
jgi:hypothetical protein